MKNKRLKDTLVRQLVNQLGEVPPILDSAYEKHKKEFTSSYEANELV